MILYPEDLISIIQSYTPSVADFYAFKDHLTNGSFDNMEKQAVLDPTFNQNLAPDPFDEEGKLYILDSGFKKLAIHQMSFSGLGAMAGGPLGGMNQTSNNHVGSRWSPNHLAKKIREIHDLFAQRNVVRGHCTSLDFSEVFAGDDQALIYLDPPYYDQGKAL